MAEVKEIRDYNSGWLRQFRKDVRKHMKEPDADTFGVLCYGLYQALVYNEGVPFSAVMSTDEYGKPKVELEIMEKVQTGQKYFVLTTKQTDDYSMVATIKIAKVFSLLRENTELEGIVIDLSLIHI